MDSPVEYLRFYDDGNAKREVENFQNYLFQDIDLRGKTIPISFFRSDFRSAKLVNSHFEENNFDRADFIDAYLENCSFTRCEFGTDFINSYFKGTRFKENKIDTCTFNECLFEDCSFSSDIIRSTGFRQCEFIRCTFENPHIEMNTFDDLIFEKTGFINVNFSNSSAHNFTFDRCSLANFIVDPDYLGSYLFKDTSLSNISFTYRGKEFTLSDDIGETLEALRNFYATNNRFAELFNLNLLHRQVSGESGPLFPLFKTVLQLTLRDEHILRKRNNLNNLFRVLQFYTDGTLISPNDYLSIVGVLESIDVHSLDLRAKIEFESNLAVIRSRTEVLLPDMAGILVSQVPMYMELQIDESDELKATNLLQSLFNKIHDNYYPGTVDRPLNLIGSHKGSLYLEVAGFTGAVLMLCYGLKYVAYSSLKLYVQYAFSKRMLKLIEEKKSMKDMQNAARTLNEIMKNPPENLKRDLKELSDVTKSIHVFPNALKDQG